MNEGPIYLREASVSFRLGPEHKNTLLLRDDSYRTGLSKEISYEHWNLAIKIPTCLPNKNITYQDQVDKLAKQKLSQSIKPQALS